MTKLERNPRPRRSWCLIFLRQTFLVSLALAIAIGTLAVEASTQEMAKILEEIAGRTPPRSSPFLNTERLALIRSVPAPEGDVNQLATYLLILGRESVLAGENAAAVEALSRLKRLAAEGKLELNAESRKRLGELLALAYLRLGEQENCVEDHTIERCLLPIKGSGVHGLTRGSRGAIEEYLELLASDPDDLSARWLLNLAYMTLGEHPEKVPPEFLIPESAFASEHPLPRFADVAPEVGLDVFGLAGGAVIEDFDRDGRLDVMASSWGFRDQLRFFRNDGNGGFTELTESAGLVGIVSGLNLVHTDYDNDGRPDVLVLRGAWLGDAGRHPNSLLRNNGVREDGRVTFTDVTVEAGLLSFRPTQVGAWADYDNDGWLDLFVGNETSGDSQRYASELFRSNGPDEAGQVTFTEVAVASGIDVAVPIKGAAWGDIDNDGFPDLFISDTNGPNLLFHNRPAAGGGRTFVEIGAEAGVREPRISFPTWFWDYDNDGWEDIFVSAYGRSLDEMVREYLRRPLDPSSLPRLYRNNGPGPDGTVTFTDEAPRSGLERILITMGANFGDLDNDGWLDFYAGTGNTGVEMVMPNRMLRNDAGRSFQDVTTAGGFGHLQKGHGIAFGDLDHDGDQDIYAVMGGAHSGDGFNNALFENPGNGNRWVSLELEGVECNRAAIGARLKLTLATPEGPRVIHRTVGTGGSFGSSTLRQEIGLGRATSIRALEIRWPGSEGVQTLDLPSLDAFYRVRQGGPEALRLERASFELGGMPGAPPAHDH